MSEASEYFESECARLSTGPWKVAWSPEDREYVATYSAFPSLSWLGRSPQEASDGLVGLVQEALEDRMTELGLGYG